MAPANTSSAKAAASRSPRPLQTILLGEVPLDQTIRMGGDHGIPVVISHPDSNPARVFRSVGLTVLQGLEKQA